MAIGAIRCIYDHDLSVPEDVAVMGMDDIPQAQYLNPPLASISAQIQAQCRMATQMLLDIINRESPCQTIQADARFHLRASFQISKESRKPFDPTKR